MIDYIIDKTLEVFTKANIRSFPIDCNDLVMALGYDIKSYSSLTEKKRIACIELSDDACFLGNTIYYNDTKRNTRIRFSLMHELGHKVLETDNERYADIFASNILAPRMVIHYSKCKNYVDVMKKFNLSDQASQIAFNDYRKWLRTANYKMSELDKRMYKHFFDPHVNKFVWKYQNCDFCYTNFAYNGETLCNECKIFELRKHIHITPYDEQQRTLDMLRGNWLYGET